MPELNVDAVDDKLDALFADDAPEADAGGEGADESAPSSPTADELREALGESAGELDDDALLKAYEELPPLDDDEEIESEDVESDEPQPWTRPFKLYRDGKPIESTKGLDAEALLDAEIGYQQDGQEVRRTIEGLARVAARVPYQDRRIAEVVQQRNATATENESLKRQIDELKKTEQWVGSLFADRTGERFANAQEQYERVMLQGGTVADMLGQPRPTLTPQPTANTDAQGELVYIQHVMPVLQQMATQYSADGSAAELGYQQSLLAQLDQTARQMIAVEGQHLTVQRLRDIIYHELPQRALDAGLKPVTAQAKSQSSSLQAELANARLKLLKAKKATAPPSTAPKRAAGKKKAAPSVEALNDVSSVDEAMDLLDDPSFTF